MRVPVLPTSRLQSTAYGCLLLLLELAALPFIDALNCHMCEGHSHCMEGKCTGEYCYQGQYRPFRSSFNMNVKGCINGSLLKQALPDQCETLRPVGEADTVDVSCLCSANDYCNRAMDLIRRRQYPLTKCYADAQPHNYCYGDYCGMSSLAGHTSRQCVQQALPMVERLLMGACTEPPAFHSMYPQTQLLNNSLACVCGDRKCNGHFPSEYQFFARQQLCDVKFSQSVTAPGRLTTKYDIGKQPMCRGQFCYQLNVLRMEGVTNISSSLSGCINYVRHWRRAHKLLPAGGTMTFDSNILRYRLVMWPYDQRMTKQNYTGDDVRSHLEQDALPHYTSLDDVDGDESKFRFAPAGGPLTPGHIEHALFGTHQQSGTNDGTSPDEQAMDDAVKPRHLHDLLLMASVGIIVALLLLIVGSFRFGVHRIHRGSYSTVNVK